LTSVTERSSNQALIQVVLATFTAAIVRLCIRFLPVDLLVLSAGLEFLDFMLKLCNLHLLCLQRLDEFFLCLEVLTKAVALCLKSLRRIVHMKLRLLFFCLRERGGLCWRGRKSIRWL
jgi:hypothetical protein